MPDLPVGDMRPEMEYHRIIKLKDGTECVLFTVEQEADFLKGKTESDRDIEMVAETDGAIVGTAGFGAVGGCYKVRHRAEFGISGYNETVHMRLEL